MRKDSHTEADVIEYQIDSKHIILVESVHNESGKRIEELILNLLIRDCDNP